jgi:hypothetical protein
MKLKRDQISGIALILIGLVIAVLVSQFKVPFKPSYPGPKAIPMLGVFGFIVCGAGIFLESTFGKKEEKTFLVKEGWVRAGVSLGMMLIYLILMNFIGFLIASPLALYAFSTYYAKGYKSTVKGRVIFSVALTIIIYVIYVFAFGLSLPGGMLFG